MSQDHSSDEIDGRNLLDGKPPKRSDQMRAVLKTVHAANPSREAGGKRRGLAPDDALHITSFHSRNVAAAFQRELSLHGLPSSTKRVGEQTLIFVDMEDRDRARALLSDFRELNEDVPPPPINKRFDLLILGVVTGVTVGIVLSLATVDTFLDMIRIGLIGVAFGLLGHLADRIRSNPRKFYRLGVYELLILAVLPGLAIVIYRITYRYLS